MSATIGKDVETGMTTITFDSTGRMVRLSKGESDDFELRMLIIKAEGSLAKESIGSKAVYALQQLGEAIVEGDPELIASIWLGTGEKIVAAGLLNNIIETMPLDNPFHLYHINDNKSSGEDVKNARIVSSAVKKLLDEMTVELLATISSGKYKDFGTADKIIAPYIERIKRWYNNKVGLSDTRSREAMLEYMKREFISIGELNAHNLAVGIYQKL